jgi:outer membrane protein W
MKLNRCRWCILIFFLASATVRAASADPNSPTDNDKAAARAGAASDPAAAAAAKAPWMAAEFGYRFVDAIPFGTVANTNGSGRDLDNLISNLVVPLWLDAGLRFASNWYVGGYFTYGLPVLANQALGGNCQSAGYGCSSHDIRLGANAQYHVFPDGLVDPWFGIGFGYEWASFTQTVDSTHSATLTAQTADSALSGWEFVNLQVGADIHRLSGALGIGPFVGLAISQYGSENADINGDRLGQTITNQALHEWFFFGARGVYDLKFE